MSGARRRLIQVIDTITKKQLDDQSKAIADQKAAMTAQQKTISDQQTALTNQATAMSTAELNDVARDKALADQAKALAEMAAKPVPIYEDAYTNVVNTPTLALNATQDLMLTWDRPFSGTNYVVSLLPDIALLGKASFVVKAKTKTTLTVTITASVLLSVQGGLRAYGRYFGLPANA